MLAVIFVETDFVGVDDGVVVLHGKVLSRTGVAGGLFQPSKIFPSSVLPSSGVLLSLDLSKLIIGIPVESLYSVLE